MKIGVSGTPGTGKTSLSRSLSKACGAHHAEISLLAKENQWVLDYDDERDTYTVDVPKIKSYLKKYEDIIIDSHFAEQFDCDIIIVIRCPPSRLYERLSSRGYPKEKIKENMLSEILDSCLINAIDSVGIDNTYEIVADELKEDVHKAMDIIGGNGKSVKNSNRVHYLTEENLDLLQRF